MSYLSAALVCGIVGTILLYLGVTARRRDVGIEGRVTMLVSGGLFMLAAVANAVVSVVTLVL